MDVISLVNSVPDWLGLIVFSIVIGTVNSLVYKFFGDSGRMKELRDEIKALTEQYKKKRSKKILERIDDVQAEYMKLTFKPMLISMVLVFLFFPIIISTYGDIRGKESITILGDNFTITYNGNYTLSGPTEITTTGIFHYKGKTFEISKAGDEFKISRVVILLPFSLPLIGRTVGWILYYIIVSLPLMSVIRKFLGVEI